MQRAKASRSIVGPLNRNGSLSLADARKHAARSRFTSASGAPGLSYTPRPLPLAQPTSSPMIPTTRIPVVGHLMALLLPAAIGGFYCTPTDFALPTARARLCWGPVCFRRQWDRDPGVPAGVYRYVSGSCVPGGTAAGGSWIVMVCPAPGVQSLGWSFTTLSAVHREMHSRPRPQEQVRNQRGR